MKLDDMLSIFEGRRADTRDGRVYLYSESLDERVKFIGFTGIFSPNFMLEAKVFLWPLASAALPLPLAAAAPSGLF